MQAFCPKERTKKHFLHRQKHWSLIRLFDSPCVKTKPRPLNQGDLIHLDKVWIKLLKSNRKFLINKDDRIDINVHIELKKQAIH